MEGESEWVVEEVNSDAIGECTSDDEAVEFVPVKSSRKRERLAAMKEKKKKARCSDLQHPMRQAELKGDEDQARSLQILLEDSTEPLTSDDFHMPIGHDLARLTAEVKLMQKQWKTKYLGTLPAAGPVLLVLTYSARRAVDIVRALKNFQGNGRLIAKLFAKHIKLSEQLEILEQGDVRVAVGTPNRVLKLCEAGGLSTESLEHVIIDMGLDAKQMNLFDVKAVRDDFLILFKKYIADRMASRGGATRLCLF